MAQWIKVLVVKPDNQRPISRTHVMEGADTVSSSHTSTANERARMCTHAIDKCILKKYKYICIYI